MKTMHGRKRSDVDRISDGVRDRDLTLNAAKYKYLVLYLNPQGARLDVSLLVDKVDLERVHTYRYWGIEIDERLTFASQTSKATRKAKQGTGALVRTLRKWAPRNVFSTAITTVILPAFFYAVEVWYPPSDKHRIQLERMLKFAARLVTNDFSRDSTYDDLLKAVNWRPIYRIVAERRLLNMKKYMDGHRYIPAYVFPMETESDDRRSSRIKAQSTSHSFQLKVFSQQRNLLEAKLAAAQSRELWNTLESYVPSLTLAAFRTEIAEDCVFDWLVKKKVLHAVIDVWNTIFC